MIPPGFRLKRKLLHRRAGCFAPPGRGGSPRKAEKQKKITFFLFPFTNPTRNQIKKNKNGPKNRGSEITNVVFCWWVWGFLGVLERTKKKATKPTAPSIYYLRFTIYDSLIMQNSARTEPSLTVGLVPRSIIIGTAGHIDHGKTALVRALTGVDADRLPEEKRRGITIDIGFADLDLGDVRIGFVDVPGHERFVKNMLAGAHGIDVVALVIAADESVMPQTREHFDICRLLGVRQGLIVITKKDLVEEDLLQLVRAEAQELVAGSFLEDAPIITVSSRTGEGIDELKNMLREIGQQAPSRSSDFITRLPIDRAFTMRGFGAVVTGTLIAGEISEGEELELLPAPSLTVGFLPGTRVRVRGVQVHGAAVARAFAGQRTAINLGGVEAAEIERGMTLTLPGRLRPTQIVDAQVQMLADAPRALRSRQRVRVHLGAAEVFARVRVLEAGGTGVPPVNHAQMRVPQSSPERLGAIAF